MNGSSAGVLSTAAPLNGIAIIFDVVGHAVVDRFMAMLYALLSPLQVKVPDPKEPLFTLTLPVQIGSVIGGNAMSTTASTKKIEQSDVDLIATLIVPVAAEPEEAFVKLTFCVPLLNVSVLGLNTGKLPDSVMS
jgi:hypothetical protein